MQDIDNEGKRLKYVREKVLNVSQEVFGTAIGRHLSSIQKWESSINVIDPSTKLLFEHVYGINPIWLETGDGDIILEGSLNAYIMPIHALSGRSYANLFKKDNTISRKRVVHSDLSHNLVDIFFTVADKATQGIEKDELLIVSKNLGNYTKSKSFAHYLVEDNDVLGVRLLQYIDKSTIIEISHPKTPELKDFPFGANIVSLEENQLKGKVVRAISVDLWKNASVILI